MLENLIKLRKSRGLRQKDIADMLKISTSAYGYWENEMNEPDLKSLITLADFYSVSIDYLVGHDKGLSAPLIIEKSDGTRYCFDLNDNELDLITQLVERISGNNHN